MKRIANVNIILGILLLSISFCWATQYEYDSLNRLSKVTYDNNVQIAYTYEDSGNQTVRVISLTPDISQDGFVDTLDLMDLSDVWLDQPCSHPDWCAAGDLDLNGKVDLSDFALLGDRWLEGTVAVPNVDGMSQQDAQVTITDSGFILGAITWAFSDTVAAGYVISQAPSEGSFVRPGETIDLVISQGPEPLPMPNLIGMTLAEAEAVILDEGLILLEVYEDYSDTVPEGHVIDQFPSEGDPVLPGDWVLLLVSLGPLPQ